MKEALKLGLEALDMMVVPRSFQAQVRIKEIYDTIKEALAQPEQETQAYREAAQLAKWLFKKHYAQEEHYASGRVVWGLCDTTAGVISQIDNMVCKLVLPKEPEQEPVAWQAEVLIQGVWSPVGNPQRDKSRAERLAAIPSIPKECQRVIELYTTPPQRTWIDLTEDEVTEIVGSSDYRYDVARAAEAKSKEKNI